MVDPHATLFLGSEIGSHLDALRARWDPGMAAQIAAHVTITYIDGLKWATASRFALRCS